MNAHGEDITDLKIIMAQLTQLQTTNTAALAAMEARVQELEVSRHSHDGDARLPPQGETFLDRPGGQLIIKGTFILAAIIMLYEVTIQKGCFSRSTNKVGKCTS